MSISEFSLFDEPPKETNNNKDFKCLTRQKLNFDNISDVFSFSKKNNLNTKPTTNDKTSITSPMTKHNIENIKEVSLFTLNEAEPKALNRKIDFCKEAEIPMEIDDINEYDNDSSNFSGNKKEEDKNEKIDDEEEDDKLRSDKKMSDD